MSEILVSVMDALGQMDVPYTFLPRLDAVVIGIETATGAHRRVLLKGNDLARDVSISGPLVGVNSRNKPRIARLIAEELNRKFKCVTFCIVEECVMVDHVVDLEFAADSEALIRKGVFRMMHAIDKALPLLVNAADGRANGRHLKAVREAERLLDELGFFG